MPNHWHLVMWPYLDELPRFMHWLTLTHAKRWQEAHGCYGTGHVYQDRYDAIPVQSDFHLIRLLRYVEANAKRANLVGRAEDWRWCSLWRRCNFRNDPLLTAWPIPLPSNWLDTVNEPEIPAELSELRHAIERGWPIGDDTWRDDAARKLEISLRSRGRPKKKPGLIFS
jgi:putative transposase